MKAKTFFIGLSAGIVGGLVATILSAPQPGKELRANIIRNANATKAKLIDVKYQASNVKNSVTNFTNEAKNNIPEIINELKETFTNFTQEIEPEATRLKQEIEGLQKSISAIEQNISQFNKSDDQQK
ncbi:YtxH domain-containing protein [Solibacillus sp. CAU 1738]|uniref:YtxH domain-containing protein n=1 Tax=Solibacillus sp. CAU 1738 TaxID=3140363 RepID=UPI003261BD56